MPIGTRRFSGFVISATLLSLLSAQAMPQAQQIESVEDAGVHRWALENYQNVLDSLLPTPSFDPANFRRDIKWMVTVRVLPPPEQREYRLSLYRLYTGKVESIVITVKGSSIFSQMQALKRQNPDASEEAISRLIAREERHISESDLPELLRLAKDFESLKMSPVVRDELVLHATRYEIWSESQFGNRLQVVLEGAGSEAKEQPCPLLGWAEDFRRVVEEHLKH